MLLRKSSKQLLSVALFIIGFALYADDKAIIEEAWSKFPEANALRKAGTATKQAIAASVLDIDLSNLTRDQEQILKKKYDKLYAKWSNDKNIDQAVRDRIKRFLDHSYRTLLTAINEGYTSTFETTPQQFAPPSSKEAELAWAEFPAANKVRNTKNAEDVARLVLGVKKGDSNTEINKKYRKLSLQYHPDKYAGDNAVGTEAFKIINQAKSILLD